ncbi:hypothetical protein GR328_03010 [Microvirga makkahensis]|uniref:Uncharacterized protein n=2 Tax=Microvirga makkahensis TaxID=1128670 RepID=A0A7X3SMS4_9HYPH|nr:hypothetical protein [Microvirga makkahensis]
MWREGTISCDLAEHLDVIEEIDNIDIETIVDDWLNLFTSDAPWRREYAQSTVFDTPDRDSYSIGFDTVLHDDTWEHWNARLEPICLQWLSNPLNLDRLETDAVTEVNLATVALQANGAILEDNFMITLWKELSFETRQAIGMKASKDKVMSPEHAQIREGLICLLTGLTRDYRKRIDDRIRAYERKHVVLIEQGTGSIIAQGTDLSEAADNLLLFGEPIYRLESTPHETEGDWVYHAFHVPACLYFNRRDAHLVKRWGVYEGSYTVVKAEAA